MNQAPKLTTYRLDNLPLLLGLLMQMNRPEIFEREIRDHALHPGLSGQLTSLPGLLVDVLRYLHLPETLYTGLGVKPAIENSVFDISIFGK